MCCGIIQLQSFCCPVGAQCYQSGSEYRCRAAGRGSPGSTSRGTPMMSPGYNNYGHMMNNNRHSNLW